MFDLTLMNKCRACGVFTDNTINGKEQLQIPCCDSSESWYCKEVLADNGVLYHSIEPGSDWLNNNEKIMINYLMQKGYHHMDDFFFFSHNIQGVYKKMLVIKNPTMMNQLSGMIMGIVKTGHIPVFISEYEKLKKGGYKMNT